MAATIEHVSDIVLHAWGTTRKEVFRSALCEMNEVLKPGGCNGPRHSDYCTRIRIESPDSVALLVDFLSEVLALSLIQKSLFCYVYFELLEEHRLSARLFGRWHDGLENEIKAVTYHEAELRRNSNGRWIANILCDL
jgi:SHS2 domain-containing protein